MYLFLSFCFLFRRKHVYIACLVFMQQKNGPDELKFTTFHHYRLLLSYSCQFVHVLFFSNFSCQKPSTWDALCTGVGQKSGQFKSLRKSNPSQILPSQLLGLFHQWDLEVLIQVNNRGIHTKKLALIGVFAKARRMKLFQIYFFSLVVYGCPKKEI